jgi:hypothetical protein
MSSSVGVARCRNFSAHCWCHLSISLSGFRGKASLGRSTGNASPLSGFLIAKFRTAVCINGTCSSGPRSISIDCHRTKPFVVRAGTDGGEKSSLVGWRVCWHPMLA